MTQSTGFENLALPDRLLVESMSRPRWAVYAATLLAVLVAWIWIAIAAAGIAEIDSAGSLGPGMAAFDSRLSWLIEVFGDNGFARFAAGLCTPIAADGWNITTLLTGFAMWMTMSVAMMLPSAAPMLRTYGDIADVAAQKGQRVVSLTVLALGYLTVWALFSVIATIVQAMLVALGVAANPTVPIHGILAGLILIGAGAYQFSDLKNACLEKCRNPFSVLFGRWTMSPTGVFKLGVEQGVFCVGCCWALMLVMLVVGTMNLAWMAFFTLFAIVEKSGKGKVTSRVSGTLLLLWGAGLLSVSALG